MSTFDEREKGFEAKYKHDQELQFKVRRSPEQAARPLGRGA